MELYQESLERVTEVVTEGFTGSYIKKVEVVIQGSTWSYIKRVQRGLQR